LIGKNCEVFPKDFQLLQSSRHSIGHHSYSHYDAWRCDAEMYYEDFIKAKNIVGNHLFRPPYGKITPRIINRIQKDFPSIKICQFNLMPGDFDGKVDAKILKERMYQAQGGDIIVLHDRPECFEKYALFLKEWIGDMRERGFSFVTL
jgi:peptidoglycan/xylan/chitin deacetylase (PgdA/CDA1 family)